MLKNCPFCGGKAEFVQFANPNNFVHVKCTICHCCTDGYLKNKLENSLKENEKIQADIWNRREQPFSQLSLF
ncbi:Lar family restriction alleviation protein [Clostridium sp. 19966]|uniref:Lar family restriction alleviation protein n=1 Tax=Clostridium sp. 19966 TaxID=2768166 RepID=UPI0028DF1245|nr:Lar family restriction alleviation protein [Clostridium sp. 19966]MDT8718191.1 Lar family restriction alleviation protein [Clostridium sp. 19966]